MGQKPNIKRRIGGAMIALGVALVVISVGYELVNYPWRLVLQKVGVAVSDELPDPEPLPKMEGAESAVSGTASDVLPENPGLFVARPKLELTWVGVLQIPKIGISENVVEGVGDEMLYGVGHMPGTPLPAEGGNCVLAAHRDYVRMNPFRYLDKVEPGDIIRLRVDDVVYEYEVFANFVVNPKDTYVTKAQEGHPDMLTLITCTPVLLSTHRMIVWADQVGNAH